MLRTSRSSNLEEEKHRSFFKKRQCDAGKSRYDKENTMPTFTLLAATTRTALLADLEGLWQRFDQLVGTLGPDDWAGKHGQHWTFTDVPYHLAYFDLDVIAAAIKGGLRFPTSKQRLRTEAEKDA